MFPQADRRPAQVAIAEVVIGPIRPEQIDAAQIARVVTDDHRLGMADPGAQDVRPVGDRVQRDAVAPDHPPFDGRKSIKEAARIGDRRRLTAPKHVSSPTMPRRQASSGVVPIPRCRSR